jgi:trehalose 6-phosphate synthase
MMTALLSKTGGHWIFSATGSSDTESESPIFPHDKVSINCVRVDDEVFRVYREDYCVRTLIWLFHYLLETSLSYRPAPGSRLAWDAYQSVNQAFTDTLLKVHDNTPDEVILVNDLHLLLVPGLFAQTVPKRNSKLAYFHHVPWCEPEYFGILPELQRTQILKSVLCADFVGFHSRRWALAFLACCQRYLPNIHIDGTSVLFNDHITWLSVSPGTADKEALARLQVEPGTASWQQQLARQASGRRVIVRVDRMDLWKNHVRGFSAFERLLDRNPSLAADVWFCAIASPTRLQTERHRNYRAACESIVDRINRRFGASAEVVSVFYPVGSQQARQQALAALSLGSIALVNPIWDGLNLVAKESVLLSEKSRLVLSVNAGVHDQLAATSLSINPFDEEATADALAQAIEDTGANAAQLAQRARAALADESASTWLDALLNPSGVF